MALRFGLPWLLLGVIVSVQSALATSQMPDRIQLDGEEVALNTNPLEGYLATHRDKRPRSSVHSTGLWRGYVANWKIADDKLLLLKVEILDDREGDGAELKDVTGRYFPEAPMVADWYTGALVVPRGELVDYVHMGYASTYEAYTILVIRSGAVIDRKDMPLTDFNQYKRRKFEEFKKSPTYATEIKRAVKNLGNEASAERFLSQFYTERYLAAPDEKHDQ